MHKSPNPTNFRLNEVEYIFNDSLAERKRQNPKLNSSSLIRWCIREALEDNDGGDITPEQADVYLNELRDLKKQLSRVGGNLNQIAQYFNTHNHLIESDLKKRQDETIRMFKDLTKVLKEVENGFIRRQY